MKDRSNPWSMLCRLATGQCRVVDLRDETVYLPLPPDAGTRLNDAVQNLVWRAMASVKVRCDLGTQMYLESDKPIDLCTSHIGLPSKTVWFESRAIVHRNASDIVNAAASIARCGWFFEELGSNELRGEVMDRLVQICPSTADAHKVHGGYAFLGDKYSVRMVATFGYALREDGTIIDDGMFFSRMVNLNVPYPDIVAGPLLTMKLLGCSNVDMRKDPCPITTKAARRSGVKKFYYHVLSIRSPGSSKRSTQIGVQVGDRVALHTCRGHFRDYRQGPGLFGRINGIFWCPEHVRGHESAGVVTKDYRHDRG